MTNKEEIKEALYKACEEDTEKRIETIKKALSSIEESRNNESKSSVGDKYETGRSMMQIEEEKAKRQLWQAIQLKQELTQIDPRKRSNRVELGSLVETTNGNYYLSIGLGKLSLENELYYCISINSPIGRKMLNKEVGEEVEFNGAKMRIEEIY